MEVSVAVKDGLERQVMVQVPEDEVSAKVAARLESLSRSARINGFRPGKVPMSVVRSRFGAQVRQEVVGEVLQSTLSQAISEQNLKPAGEPTIDPLDAEPGKGISYTATFEVFPEIEVAPLEALEIVRPEAQISDEDVDEMVESLRRQHMTYETVERPAGDEDRLTIDFTGTVDGEPFEGGSGEDIQIVLGQSQFIPGFEEGLVGLSAGDEKTIEVTFPEDYRAEQLAGRPAAFAVTLKEVAEPRLPALDEAFFSRFNLETADLEAFREDVRRNMARERDTAAQSLTKRRVMDALLAANEITLPTALVQREQHRLLHEMKHMLGANGAAAGQLEGLSADLFADRAADRVKLGLIVSELTATAAIVADPAAVRAEIEKVAATYEQPDEVIRWYYEKPERLNEVEALCAENALVDWILERAKVSSETMKFQELMEANRNSGAS